MNRLSRYCDGVMEAAWLLALVSVPLFFNLDARIPFDIEKMALVRSIGWVAAAAWLVKVLSEGELRFENLPRPKSIKDFLSEPLVAPVAALVLSYLISTAFSIFPRVSFFGSYGRLDGTLTRSGFILLFIVMAVNLRRRAQVERLLTTVCVVSFPVAIYAILQHYNLDPYQWNAFNVERSVSTIGHPIFSAAYLSMSLFVILGRLLLSLSNKDRFNGKNLIRSGLYAGLAILDLAAILFAVARGPLIGLFAGLTFFGLAILAIWRLRKVFFGFAAFALLALIVLVVLNIPGGPLARFRDVPGLSSFGHIFDAEAGTGRIRSLLWDGMSRLAAPHAPLNFPNRTTDSLNFIRPLVGYGPETIRYTFESYYNPEMFSLEARDIVYDHSHNEFWDSLALNGILGMLAEYGFFLALIYFGLKWVGFIAGLKDRNLFLWLSLGGGLLGALVSMVFMGAGFLGLGLPFGLLTGAFGILVYRIFRPASQSPQTGWRAMTIIALLAAIISHYVEVLFGISVGVTLLLLWEFAALLFVLGRVLPAVPAASEAQPKPSRKTVARTNQPPSLREVGINALLVITILTTLTMDFITPSGVAGENYADILNNSLSVVFEKPGTASFGILGLFLGTLLFTGLLIQIEEDYLKDRKFNSFNLLFVTGAGLFCMTLAWFLRAIHGAVFIQINPDQTEVFSQAVFWKLAAFYIGLFLIMLAGGALLMESEGILRKPARNPLVYAGYFGLPLLVLSGVYIFNLRPMHADMLFGKAMALSVQSQSQAATNLLDAAIALTPSQDYYVNAAAKMALQDSHSVQDSYQQKNLAKLSLDYAQSAFKLAPFYVDYSLDEARAHIRMADFANSPDDQTSELRMASQMFATAVTIKPGQVDYRGEWAELLLLQKDPSGAQQTVEKALSIDPTYEPLHYTAGKVYASLAEAQPEGDLRNQLLHKSLDEFQTDAKMLTTSGGNPAQTLIDVVRMQEALAQYEAARQTCLQIIDLGIGADQWQVYQKLSELSGKLNDVGAQIDYLKKAIAIAPPDKLSALEDSLNKIKP